MDRQRAQALVISALEAAAPIALVAVFALVARRFVDDGEPAPRALVTWSVTGAGALALWLVGLALRRTDRGLRILLALACGLAISGGIAIWLAENEPFPRNMGRPETELGTLGLQAMAVALGGLVAAFGIDYRRSDPWYVLAFAAALAPMAVTLGLWLAGFEEASWL